MRVGCIPYYAPTKMIRQISELSRGICTRIQPGKHRRGRNAHHIHEDIQAAAMWHRHECTPDTQSSADVNKCIQQRDETLASFK
ncbi:hypothetical protein J2776_002918 [Paraburkholderia caledonica]|uniref:Uncharacterized protein n=1 Tax=Paraburkholderia caledonica TaxID=134536 RepID=A0ABU1KZ18_9BURK|nr:hypothetical protein [Paraburkholderia caledonica]